MNEYKIAVMAEYRRLLTANDVSWIISQRLLTDRKILFLCALLEGACNMQLALQYGSELIVACHEVRGERLIGQFIWNG